MLRRMNAFRPAGREPMLNLPPMTAALIVVNLGVEVVRLLLSERQDIELVFRFGFVPALYGHPGGPDMESLLAPLTYQFLHGGWLHVGLNMVSLAAFGSGVERLFGPYRYLAYYLFCGVIAAGVHYLVFPNGQMPVIGASGAISGIFGGVLIVLWRRGSGSLWVMGGLWVAMTVIFGMAPVTGADEGPIAWQAHIGGFIAGLAAFRLFAPRHVW